MYANPASATAMPRGALGSVMRATVPSPRPIGRSADTGPVSVGVEQPSASVAPSATAPLIVVNRFMRPFSELVLTTHRQGAYTVATRSAQYVIDLMIEMRRARGGRRAPCRASRPHLPR